MIGRIEYPLTRPTTGTEGGAAVRRIDRAATMHSGVALNGIVLRGVRELRRQQDALGRRQRLMERVQLLHQTLYVRLGNPELLAHFVLPRPHRRGQAPAVGYASTPTASCLSAR